MREDVQQDLQGRCQWEIIVLEYFREIHDTGTFDREVIDDLDILSRKIAGLLNVASEEEETDNQDTLSQREKEIVVCVVKGMTNKEIAEKLFLSIHTVITHRRNISKKLQIHSAAGLTIYAIVNKLVTLNEVKGL